MRGEFVDLDDTRLYCFASGTRGVGEPIVLLHSAFTSSHLWRDLLPRLPKGHRVLVVDLLGHGRSDHPREADFGTHAHARRVIALLDVLGVEPACVVGHGVGAAIAASLALQAPERVTRLMLCNPCLIRTAGEDAPAPRSFRRLARATPLWRRLPPDWVASALHSALVRGYSNKLLAAHVMDVYLKAFRSDAGREVACRQLESVCAASSVVELPSGALSMPVGLMLGAADPFTPRGGEPLRRSLAASVLGEFTVHRLAGMSHAIPEEAPDRLAIAVAELLVQ
jgi:pimeloyl-ACP methyl ester carboxylesterase